MKIEYPCAKCKQQDKCSVICAEWKAWFCEIWPIVTGKKVDEDARKK